MTGTVSYSGNTATFTPVRLRPAIAIRPRSAEPLRTEWHSSGKRFYMETHDQHDSDGAIY